MRPRWFAWLLRCLYLATAVAVVMLLVNGADYYLTPLGLRARHADFWTLKPGGTLGHALGVVGSAMMVLLLLYSVRKRSTRLRRVGTLARWLDIHIWLGVSGPLLVILHSSFKVQGIVALSFWSMVVVAASGVLGRYLYLQIPRSRAGDELGLQALEQQDQVLTEQISQEFGIPPEQLEAITTAITGAGGDRGSLRTLLTALFDDVLMAWRVRHALAPLGLPHDLGRRVARLLGDKARLRRRIQMWTAMQRLFHYWHVLHRPLAAVMYLFMVVHVLVALVTGYAFGGH